MKHQRSQRMNRILRCLRFDAAGVVCIVLTVAASVACRAQEQGTRLFRIVDHGRYGYIDSSGAIIIPPVFRSASDFSEGLAPARMGGLYGFIDRTGHFFVEPRFDFASGFSNGRAVVWLKGKPAVIDHNGRLPFVTPYANIEAFENGRARVVTANGHMGVIDTNGRLIVDTIYASVGRFVEGLAVVVRCDAEHNDGRRPEHCTAGMVDTNGLVVVACGRYSSIEPFEGGYAKFELREGVKEWTSGYLDRSGRMVFMLPSGNARWSIPPVRDGMVVVSIERLDSGGSASGQNYDGIMSLDERVLLNLPAYDNVAIMGHGLAAVSARSGPRHLISLTGRRLDSVTFNWIDPAGFQNGIAIVSNWGTGAVDTNGRVIIPLRYDRINPDPLPDGTMLASWGASDAASKSLWGIIDVHGNVVLEARYDQIDPSGFHSGVIAVMEGDRAGYVDRSGRYVWRQQASDISGIEDTLDIDVMNRGYYYAYSSGKDGRDGRGHSGGWSESSNSPERSGATAIVASDTFAVVARPDISAPYDEHYPGFRVYVVNTTADSIIFDAQDSRLEMTVQALDADGEWHDIEYLPRSWCGNSYHLLTLKPGEYWTFTAPCYHGEVQTRFRLALQSRDPAGKRELESTDDPAQRREPLRRTIYSNEWSGSVNPGQFWRRQEYSPNGLMDPYRE